MEEIRKYFWLILILGIIFVSMVIAVIFILINKCISKREGQYTNFLQNSRPQFYTQNSQYHPKHLEDDLPPLPPRHIPVIIPSCPASPGREDNSNLPDYLKVINSTPPPPYKHKETPVFSSGCPVNDDASLGSYDDVIAPSLESEDYDDIA